MTWTKLSDDFGDDCWRLTDRAFRTHVEGLGWSNRKLLDCIVSKDDVRRFAKHPEAATELVASGYWADLGDAFKIRHHAGYQREREDVIAQQEANRKNGRKGGRPRNKPNPTPPDPTPEETHSETDSLSESETERDGTGRAKTGATLNEVKQQVSTEADEVSSAFWSGVEEEAS